MRAELETAVEACTGTEARSDLPLFVTARDRELMSLLAICRYLSTAQANRLLRPGRHESGGRRRLALLAGLAPTGGRGRPRKSGRPVVVFNPPYLRRLQARVVTGELVHMWTLAPRGYALASELLGGTRRMPKNDVADPFLEHWMATTDLFVELAEPLLHSGLSARELPFRWLPEDGVGLPWKEWDAEQGIDRDRRIVPDAVLEVPALKRRWFVECEMGTHSIVAASDEKAGATVAKTGRYAALLAPRAGMPLGFYGASYADGWPPEVIFLVRDDGRAATVNRALDTLRAREGSRLAARALTLARFVEELKALLPQIYSAMPAAPAPLPPFRRAAPVAGASGGRALTAEEVETLASFVEESRARATGRGLGGTIEQVRAYAALSASAERILQRLRSTGASEGGGR